MIEPFGRDAVIGLLVREPHDQHRLAQPIDLRRNAQLFANRGKARIGGDQQPRGECASVGQRHPRTCAIGMDMLDPGTREQGDAILPLHRVEQALADQMVGDETPQPVLRPAVGIEAERQRRAAIIDQRGPQREDRAAPAWRPIGG